jgi:hypothetical protein
MGKAIGKVFSVTWRKLLVRFLGWRWGVGEEPSGAVD